MLSALWRFRIDGFSINVFSTYLKSYTSKCVNYISSLIYDISNIISNFVISFF